MSTKLDSVLSAIDAANMADPTRDAGLPAALRYGQRMTAMLEEFAPGANEQLQIAARAQHIERWIIPRETYPEGRVGYLSWRKELQRHHARRTGEIMSVHGYEEEAVARVGSLLRKERLKLDADVQTLEDVICLVFLKHEASAFIAKHDDEKVRSILAKTVTKMSEGGLQSASRLVLNSRLAKLLGEALRLQEPHS